MSDADREYSLSHERARTQPLDAVNSNDFWASVSVPCATYMSRKALRAQKQTLLLAGSEELPQARSFSGGVSCDFLTGSSFRPPVKPSQIKAKDIAGLAAELIEALYCAIKSIVDSLEYVFLSRLEAVDTNELLRVSVLVSIDLV